MKTTNDETIPSGSEVPVDAGQTKAEDKTVETRDDNKGSEDKKSEESETTKLKSELANLQKVMGRQGRELGDLRKQSQNSSQEDSGKDYDALEADITDRLDAGELDLKTALKEMNRLATERGALAATEMMREEQQESRSKQAVAEFRAKNPDFDNVVESGELDEILASNPIHDNFSAYQEFRRNQVLSDMEAKVAEARKAGEEEGRKIAAEAKNATQVLGKKGDDTKPEIKQTTTRAETNKAMLDALKGARSQ